MAKACNFLLFQAGWLACVLGAARGHHAWGPVVVALICAMHLVGARRRRREASLMLLAGAVGTALDSVTAGCGWVDFAGAGPVAWMCPPWITALWVNFASTLNSSLRWIQRRIGLSIVLGVVGGPLAYWAGARLGAVSFAPSPTAGLGAVALQWGLAMPLLSWAARSLFASEPAGSVTRPALRPEVSQ